MSALALYNIDMGESYEDEIWRDISGSPGRQVSNLGQIRSFWNSKGLTAKPRLLLKSNFAWSSNIQIPINGIVIGHNIAKLVMSHFGPPPPSLDHVIGRIDGDNRNDKLDNLVWMTQSEVRIKSKRVHSSKYHGVSIYRGGTDNSRWMAQVVKKLPEPVAVKKTFPYTPEGEIEAAKWRDMKALEIQGPFATLNFPKEVSNG